MKRAESRQINLRRLRLGRQKAVVVVIKADTDRAQRGDDSVSGLSFSGPIKSAEPV